MSKITTSQIVEAWSPLMEDVEGLPNVQDSNKRAVLAQVLENTRNDGLMNYGVSGFELNEAAPMNNSGITAGGVDPAGFAKYDPIMVGMLRRSMPNLMAFDVMGTQALNGPTGLIFSIRARYGDRTGPEALFNEADTDFTGAGTHAGSNPVSGAYTTGTGMTTPVGEALGTSGGGTWPEMSFTIEKISVAAKTRAVKAEYTTELAQDFKAVHGGDAETELSNILSNELIFETNRQCIRTLYTVAMTGALTTAVPGTFDLDVDANGRWSVEKFKGLGFQLGREANLVAQRTRRGKANIMIVSADVAIALQAAGQLDYAPALDATTKIGDVDDTGNTFVGYFGKIKVFIDPYSANLNAASQFAVLGYRGSQWDAGLYYCPYTPIQMVKAIDPSSFQQKIAFKKREGLVSNPFVFKADGSQDGEQLTAGRNHYYNKIAITNLM